jgi:nitroimidazol reductase NimA-like FMN-containing flavoprotein (pyridoxamine 5'-phosphate oxidase superfamily)
MAATYKATERTRVRRMPKRGVYDREVVHKIIDEAIVCHIGVSVDGKPRVIPTAVLRIDEFIYVHGSINSQLLKALAAGAQACITITHIDGLVAARSGFNCAVDYRSVVIFAQAEDIKDAKEKAAVFDRFVEHIVPGHKVRPPNKKELNATKILRFPIVEVSAKVRDTGVNDFEEDLALDNWAGTIPMKTVFGPPKSCKKLRPEIAIPDYAKARA